MQRFFTNQCDLDSFIKWEVILFLPCKCAILGTTNTKIEDESLFIEQNCVGFEPKVSFQKVS